MKQGGNCMKNLIEKCFKEERYDEIKSLLKGNEDLDSKIMLAKTHNILEEFEDAFQILKDVNHNDESLFQWMFTCNALTYYEETIKSFRSVKNKIIDFYLLTVVAHLALKQYEETYQLLDEASKLDEKQAVIQYYYYYTYTQQQRFEDAQLAAKKAYEIDQSLFSLRNYMSASLILDDFNAVLQAYVPNNHPEVNWFYFVALTQTGQHEKAVELGEQLHALHPEFEYLADGLAFNYMQLQNYEKVITFAKEYEDHPDNALRMRNLDMIRISYEKLENKEKAREYLEKLAADADKNLEVYNETEKLYKEEKYEEIVELLKDIHTPTAYRQLAATYFHLKNFEESARLSKILLETKQENDVRMIGVLAMLYSQQFEDAKTELLKMESDEVVLNFVYAHLSSIFMQENNIEEATHYAYQLVQVESTFENHAHLAQLYGMQHQENEAIQELEKALNTTEDDMQKQYAHKHLGVLNLHVGNYEKAYQYLSSVTYENKDELWVAYHKAIVCMELKKFEEAIECLSFLMQQDEYTDEIVYRLALCYIETQRNNEFTAIYDQCESLATKSDSNRQWFEYINVKAFRTGG